MDEQKLAEEIFRDLEHDLCDIDPDTIEVEEDIENPGNFIITYELINE